MLSLALLVIAVAFGEPLCSPAEPAEQAFLDAHLVPITCSTNGVVCQNFTGKCHVVALGLPGGLDVQKNVAFDFFFPELTYAEGLSLYNAPGVTLFLAPKLIFTNRLWVRFTGVTSVSAPNLISVISGLFISQNANLVSCDFTLLTNQTGSTSTYDIDILDNPKLDSFSLPSFETPVRFHFSVSLLIFFSVCFIIFFFYFFFFFSERVARCLLSAFPK